MKPQALLDILFALPQVGDGSNVREFLKSWGESSGLSAAFGFNAAHTSAFDRLVWVALRADRRTMAAAAGHQAAIRRLFPETPVNAITAICISEDEGPRPSKIKSTITPRDDGSWLLNGTKRWGTMAPDADVLYVAASVGFVDGRNQLRMIRLPADREGIAKDLTPYVERNAEMRICDLAFDDVLVEAGEVIEADAYEGYIKPFRLIEDVYGTAATQIALMRVALSHGWPETVIEDLASLVLQARNVAYTSLSKPTDVLLMSAYLRASDQLWKGLDECWAVLPEALRSQWRPEQALLEVAARARETRRQNAWKAIHAG